MAYVDQELKSKLAPGIKAVLKEYGMKGTISVRNHSTLVVTIKKGALDVAADRAPSEYAWRGHSDVNTYHIDSHWNGKTCEFLLKLKAAMSKGNYDHSDIQTDYFCVGWYTDINLGTWNCAYTCTTEGATA